MNVVSDGPVSGPAGARRNGHPGHGAGRRPSTTGRCDHIDGSGSRGGADGSAAGAQRINATDRESSGYIACCAHCKSLRIGGPGQIARPAREDERGRRCFRQLDGSSGVVESIGRRRTRRDASAVGRTYVRGELILGGEVGGDSGSARRGRHGMRLSSAIAPIRENLPGGSGALGRSYRDGVV